MKPVWVVVGVVAALLVALVVLWTTSIDRVVALALEHYGSDALGTAVTVEDVELRTAAGGGTIRGLRVAQPEGFGAGDAISVDRITLDLDVASLASGDPYVVSLVHVDGPMIAFVLRKDGTSNVQILQDNVSRYGASDAAEPAPPTEEGPALRLRIDAIAIDRGRIDADLAAVGVGSTRAELPAFRMQNVGGRAGAAPGAIAASVGSRFLGHVLTSVTGSAIGRQLDRLIDDGGSGVRKLLDSLFGR